MTRRSVLFANDDVLTQWEMTDTLTRAGFAVTSACRCQGVLDLLTDASDFDVLLADLDLPGAPGCNTIARVWQRWCPLRPVVFTGTSRTLLDHPLLPQEWYLKVPFTGPALLQTIVAALEHSRLARPATDWPAQPHALH